MLTARPARTAVRRAMAPVEGRIMIGAQQMVDAWFQADNRGPFARAVTRAVEQQWPGIAADDPRRIAYQRVANAIRLGRGHAFADAAPLLRIVRKTIYQK